MRTASLGIWVFVIMSTVFNVFGNGEVDSYIKNGYSKIENCEYYEAIREFNKAVKLSSQSALAFRGRAEAKLSISEYGEALFDANKSILIDKNYAEAYLTRGKVYAGMGNYIDALTDFQVSLALSPDLTESFVQRVLVLHQLNRTKESYTLVNEAIKQGKNLASNYYARGILNSLTGKENKAISDLTKCIEIDKDYNSHSVYMARGTVMMKLLDYAGAINDFGIAIGLKPKNATSLVARGLAYYELSKYPEAIGDFNASLSLNPNNGAAYYNLAMSHYKQEETSKACEFFHKACSMGNKNACKMAVLNCSEINK